MLVGSLECIYVKLDQFMGGRMFRHILFIKDNSIFMNHLQWFWKIHHVFDWFIRLIILKVFLLCHGISAYIGLIGSACLFFFFFFFISYKKIRQRMPKQSQKLRSKVKESFAKLVNSFHQNWYIYIYIYIYIYYMCVSIYIYFVPHHIWSSYPVDSLI